MNAKEPKWSVEEENTQRLISRAKRWATLSAVSHREKTRWIL